MYLAFNFHVFSIKIRIPIQECIKNVKLKTTLDSLCDNLPSEFIDIVSYTRQLRFDEQPAYSYVRKRLTHLFQREGFVQENV